MEDFDDDFGDLYAGVEEQANSAINGVPSFGKLYVEPEEDANGDNNETKTATTGSADGLEADEKPNSVPEELGEKVLALEEDEDYDGSESEDDLKIVLNDEDCEGQMFPIGGRGSTKIDEHEAEEEDGFVATNEYKYVRTQGAACSSNGKANGAVGLESSMVVRGEYANSMCNQQKGSSSQITGICDKPGPLVTHNRYGFRLPWYRTILDVNIESFEEKPWRIPRVDITDYFNFGLDEDNWKQYYNSLEQLRLTRMQLGIPFSGSSKFYQAKEAGSEYEKFAQETIVKQMNSAGPTKLAPSSRVSDFGMGELELPKGRAIEIEDSAVERQPSFGSRQPRSLDSDVVIQIIVQDMTEDNSSSGEDHSRTNGIAYEASENGEFDANNNQIIPDKYMMEAQISLGDEDEISPTSSYFASDSEATKNSVHFDPEDVCTPVRSPVNPDTELCESVRSSLKNSKGNSIKRKLIDTDENSTQKSPAHKESKHHYRRLGSIIEPNIYTVHDDDASPTSGTEDLYDRDSSLNSRRNKWRGDIGSGDREDYSGYKESSHVGSRNVYDHVDSARTNYLNRRASQKFRDNLDPYVRKTWNEREYFCEDRDTDSSLFGNTQFTKERRSLPSRDFSGWHSMYSSHTVEERDSQSRRNGNKLQFKKIHNYSGVYDKHEDGFVEEKFGRCVSLVDRRRNTSDEFEERQFPRGSRELKYSGGRGGYVETPVCYWDNSCSAQTEDEYCRRENQRLPESYRELYTADEGKWNDCLSPRTDVSYSRKTDERYWRHRRNSYSGGARESDWFDSRYDVDEIDDIIYPKDHFESRRSNWPSELLQCTEDQLSVRHHGDRLYSEKASCSYQKYVRHENFHVKWGSSHDARHIDDMLPEHLRLKLMRKGISANCINRGSKVYSGNPKQVVLTQRDSNNLVVGEGKVKSGESKSSGRFSKGRNLKGNTKLENMDPETTLVDSSEYEKVRTVQFDTPKGGCNQSKKRRMDKFPVLPQNDVLNVDVEGRIVADEVNTARPFQRKRASEYSAVAPNVKQQMVDNESASSEKKVVEGYDNQRILATMAKMEKRGERFKEPITLKKEPDKLSQPELDLQVESAEAQVHRPTRKRRWGRVEVV